jgi:hypothetical protein
MVAIRVDAGPSRTIESPPATKTPTRLPWRSARKANAATAASAISRFSHNVVPKSRLAELSTTIHVSSSRSASVVRICGERDRAVRFQSIWRASSPRAIRTRRGRFGTGPRESSEVLTAQQSVEAARHEQLEAAQLRRLARERRGVVPRRVGRLTHAVS